MQTYSRSTSCRRWYASFVHIYSCFLRATAYMLYRIYAMPIPSAERIMEILLRSYRPIFLVFGYQGSLRKSDGFTPNGIAKYKGVSNFWLICGYISETVIDRGRVTMEDKYKVVCALSNSATFDDLEWPRTPVSRSWYSLKANISQTVHPINSRFGSRLWFSGSADRMAIFVIR